MGTFSMTCSCGDSMTLEASHRQEAVAKLQGMMTEDMVKVHMAEKHLGEPVPPIVEAHAMIAQKVEEAQ